MDERKGHKYIPNPDGSGPDIWMLTKDTPPTILIQPDQIKGVKVDHAIPVYVDPRSLDKMTEGERSKMMERLVRASEDFLKSRISGTDNDQSE